MTSDNEIEAEAQLVAELEHLDSAIRAAPPGDTNAEMALWHYVAALDNWFFISRGNPEQPTPYAVAAEPGPMIALYSTPARATEAARLLGLVGEGESAPLLGVPVRAAVDYLASFGQAGVVGVTLDYPMIGAFTPLPNLQIFKGWLAAPAQ